MKIFKKKTERESTLDRVKDASKKVESVKAEGPFDLVIIPKNYEIVKVPITLGYSLGEVNLYWEKGDPVHEKFRDFCRDKLCDQLNCKKHNDSVKEKRDIGPVPAVANFIEDGDYKLFLDLFNEYMVYEIRKALMEEGEYKQLISALSKPITKEIHDEIIDDIREAIEERKLKSMEHVFLVKDERTGKFYHIMPADQHVKMAYENLEQYGLILASVAWSHKEKIYEGSITEDECSKAIANWVEENNKINADKARKILEGSMVSKLEGSDREYKNCIIFENVAEKMKSICIPKS
jgi:hypothetical protein